MSRPKILLIIGIILFLSVHPISVSATTYYIAPTVNPDGTTNTVGADTNPGTLTQPWKTFSRAWNKTTGLQAGDTLILLNGTYYQYMHPTGNVGTPTQPITIKAYEDGQSTIDAQYRKDTVSFGSMPIMDVFYVMEGFNARNGYNAVIRSEDRNYLTFRRIHAYNEVVAFDDFPWKTDDTQAIFNVSGDYNLIEDCIATGMAKKGIRSFHGHITVRRTMVEWIWTNDHYTYGSYPWCGGMNDYQSMSNTYENMIILDSKDNCYGFNNHGAGTSTTDVEAIGGTRFLGSMVLGEGFQRDGTPYIWSPIRPQPTVNGGTSALSGGIEGLGYSGAQGFRRVLFRDFVAVNNSGIGVDTGIPSPDYFNQYIAPDIEVNVNRMTYSSILNNSLLGDGRELYKPVDDTIFRISDSYIEDDPVRTGPGADIHYQYIDGVKTNIPLWPWPMEQRIRDELGYSFTNRVKRQLDKAMAGKTLPQSVRDGLTIAAVPAPPEPMISTNTTYVAFPATVVGQSSEQTLTIRNSGAANLVISKYRIVNDLNLDAFSLSGTGTCPTTFPYTLTPGQSCTLGLRFTARDLTFYPGRIFIYPQVARVNHPHIVSLLGIGHPATKTVTLPGTIRAEYYQSGYDTSSLEAYELPTFTHNVSVRPTIENNNTVYGFKIGDIDENEWVIYPINVPTPGTYTVTFSTSSAYPLPKSLQVLVLRPGTNTVVTETTVTLPTTGNSNTFAQTTATLTLPTGLYDLKLFFTTRGYDLDTITFALAGDSNKLGDANGDNRVDGLDYVVWLNHYGGTATGVASGDFNMDNRIDGLDYVIWLNRYGT